MAPQKACPVCRSLVSIFSTSPSTCVNRKGTVLKHGEDERACSECWELYLSMQVEEQPAVRIAQAGDHTTNIECMFCPTPLSRAELKRLSLLDTIVRYDTKQIRATRRKCQARCQGIDTPFEDFDRAVDGRIFTCQNCNSATCVDCDLPEHSGQTCEENRDRIESDPNRIAAEAATSNSAHLKDARIIGRCPNCSVTFDKVEKNCGFVSCGPGKEMAERDVTGGCDFRFCSICLVPWRGRGSVSLCGSLQHKPFCKHHFGLCSKCTRKIHPNESCEENAARIAPIADAENRRQNSASGEKNWETIHGSKNRFEMSATFLERKNAAKERKARKRRADEQNGDIGSNHMGLMKSTKKSKV